jgi:methionine synthase II (cobalamin-independent)
MAEQIYHSGEASASAPDTPKSISEQAWSTGRELKDKASDIASASADTLKGQASDFVDAAKDVASQATDKLKEAVSDKKSAGAEYIGSLADTIRRAAREFDNDFPLAGSYIRKAASQVETVSESIRTGEFNDIVRNAQSFARRQPTAFLGLAALTGFAIVRFLKSSPASSVSSGAMKAPNKEHAPAHPDNTGYRDDFSN